MDRIDYKPKFHVTVFQIFFMLYLGTPNILEIKYLGKLIFWKDLFDFEIYFKMITKIDLSLQKKERTKISYHT